jgi:hypothetical protein
MVEVGIKVHVSRTEMIRQFSAEVRNERRESAIRLLQSRVNFATFWNCHVDEFSGRRFNDTIP